MFNYYLKLSWLSLKSTPVVSVLMVLAIAIGIGVSMTTLTIYHMMDANPIAHKSEHLFSIQLQTRDESGEDYVPQQLTYQDAMLLRQSNIPTRHTPMYVSGFSVQTDNKDIDPFFESARLTDRVFFEMFDVAFIHGAAWDDAVDEIGQKVVVISNTLNNKLFGGENSVGKIVAFDGTPFIISGVIEDFNPSPKFYDLNNGNFNNGEAVFIPFSLGPVLELSSWGNNNRWKNETINTYQGKMTSEVMWIQYWVELPTVDQHQQFQTFLDAHVQEQQKLGRFTRNDAAGYMSNVQQWLDQKQVVADDFSVLVGLSFMFLAVCLVNTIGLLLAKFLGRAAEIGVRRALGASQLEVFKQHLIEISLIGFVGGLAGLLFTFGGLTGLRIINPNFEVVANLNVTMIVSVFVISIASSVVAGLYPAYRICKTNPAVHLKTQ
jgi:putative ABC transport system permease protein